MLLAAEIVAMTGIILIFAMIGYLFLTELACIR